MEHAISQKNMTTLNDNNTTATCPAELLIKTLSGKWKPQIFRIATEGSIRFNALLRQIEGSNKQSIATALNELQEQGLLIKTIINEKPLHIEYHLSEKGKSLIDIFHQLESLSDNELLKNE